MTPGKAAFGKTSDSRALPPPPIAQERADSVETRIRQLFDAEWLAPTDKPTDITDKS